MLRVLIKIVSARKGGGLSKPPPFYLRFRKLAVAYAFLSPWLIGFIIFTGGPIFATFFLSFTEWNLIQPPKWIGLQNFVSLFKTNSDFWIVLKNTLVYTFLVVVISVAWALFTAVLLNQRLPGVVLAETLFFAPAVVPYVALTFAFQLILRKDLGIINYWLNCIGIKNPPNWLMDTKIVLFVLPSLSIYTFYTGEMMLIFNSALKQVPKELYEAAAIDGAGWFTAFRCITLPAISPIILFNFVTAIINTLNMSFTLIYPLTGGGPGKATTVLSVDIYHTAFKLFRIGYACAESVVMFLIAALLTIMVFRLSERMVYYEV
jgi:multiple sugar transport system permease protein